MTDAHTNDDTNETRQEFIDRIAKRYQVPFDLIRYQTIEQTERDND